MIEGVEQLEIYFGQYLPQLIVSILTPFLIFGVVAVFDVPIALVMLACRSFYADRAASVSPLGRQKISRAGA
jgi:ABC-type transport system involved in cytochrome bd biosynthesis fused ATPase/permease subunit